MSKLETLKPKTNKPGNPIETLACQLLEDCPAATASLDMPKKASGVWFLEAALDGHSVIVQWQEQHGFGVSSSANAQYGAGPDEVYNESAAARHRVLSLLLSRGETSPPAAVRLADLRRELGLSQIDLAERLHIQQGAVSRLERRGDLKISTLRDYCQSLGGQLTLLANFPDGVAKVICLGDGGAE